MTAVLSTQGVSVRFGGVHALSDVDLQVGEGQLVGLIGPNGAGKTTFIDAITGFVPCSGSVELEGTDLTHLAPGRACAPRADQDLAGGGAVRRPHGAREPHRGRQAGVVARDGPRHHQGRLAA